MNRAGNLGGPVRYGGWSRDRQGWFLGLSGTAWVFIVAGGLPLLLAVGAHAWPVAAAWCPVWVLLIVLVAVPVRGRSALRWAADCLLHATGGLAGWTGWQSRAASGVLDDLDQADLPGVLSGVRVFDGPPYGPQLRRPAIVADGREHSWAVVARLTHPGIGLAEAPDRLRMGNGLAELLNGAATGELASRLAIQIRTQPDDGAHRAAWQQEHRRADAPPLAIAADAESSALLTRAGVRHEVFLTVVIAEQRIARPAREAGGGVDGRARVLYAVMGELEARLLGPLGATAVSWLDAAGLAAAIRSGFAPGDQALLGRLADGPPAGWPMAAAGPSTAPPAPARHYPHDAWSSVTCTLLLPDKGAVLGALAPVLAPSVAGERRAVTVFFEPIPDATATRLVGTESMSSELAAELRRRSGFRTRAAHRRDAARVDGQDLQLAEGNALVRVAIAAAVTVPNTWSINDHGRRLEAAITAAGFKPLRLDLAQDAGFAAAAIPLGIGLPRRRGLR